MTSVFDGMAGIINGTLGGTVGVAIGGGPSVDYRGILRRGPVEILDEETGVFVNSVRNVVALHKEDVPNIGRGDLIYGPDGTVYKYVSSLPSGSPAGDAFIDCLLDEVT